MSMLADLHVLVSIHTSEKYNAELQPLEIPLEGPEVGQDHQRPSQLNAKLILKSLLLAVERRVSYAVQAHSTKAPSR